MPPSTRQAAAAQMLLAFYSPTTAGPDTKGRTLADMLSWSANKLESCHDYIQILFPLPEESGFNWNAPSVNREIFEAFRGDDAEGEGLRAGLRKSWVRLCWFYGFKVENEEEGGIVKVIPGPNFQTHSQNWNVRGDHNHLRISRIIRSLRVLGLEEEAQAFYAALEETTPLHVSSRSREFWRRAAERSLNIRPDMEVRDEQDDGVGPVFLREWVRREKGAESEEGDGEKDLGALDY